MQKLTLELPDLLVRDAKEAADKLGISLHRFMMQAIFVHVQELPTKREPIVIDNQRFRRDNEWIDENAQQLFEQYENQWIIVYNQKVWGANRDRGRAERQARAKIGDIHRLGAIAWFMGGDRVFF